MHGALSLDIMPLVHAIGQDLAFLGIRIQSEAGRGAGLPEQVSTADSAIPVFVTAYDQWAMLDGWTQSLDNKKEQTI